MPWVRTGLWSLDDSTEAADVIADAQQHPERYVLKPQREGGGNNLYGDKLASRLADSSGLAAYILMQRIFPPVQPCAPYLCIFARLYFCQSVQKAGFACGHAAPLCSYGNCDLVLHCCKALNMLSSVRYIDILR